MQLLSDPETVDAYKMFNFDHYFRSLSFGDPSQRDLILTKFSDYPEHTRFDMVGAQFYDNQAKFSFDSEDVHFNNYKFAVLVPHTFIDSTEGVTKTYESFSYSFT
jgi:hypothetical protein